MDTSCAVLFVDLQEGLVEAARTQTAAGVRRGALALTKVAKALSLRCYASGIPLGPQGAPPLLAEIAAEIPGLNMTIRRSFGVETSEANDGAPLLTHRTVLLAGVLTEAAVLRTALNLRRSGLNVRVILDACAGLSDRTESAALRQIEAAGASATSVASVAAELIDDLTSPSGNAVLGALRGLLS
jgi:nicotinamidase-related amidase